MEHMLVTIIEPYIDDETIKNVCIALAHYKIDSFMIFHRRNEKKIYKIIKK